MADKYTLDQLNALPDAELDRLAAELVMGWKYQLGLGRPADYAIYDDGKGSGYFVISYNPTTDRNQSGELLEKVASNSLVVMQIVIAGSGSEIRWWIPAMPLSSWNIIPGNGPRSETIAAILAALAMEES